MYNTLIMWTQTIILTGSVVNNISQKIWNQACETTPQSSLARYSLAKSSLAKLSLAKLSLTQLMEYDWWD